MYRGSITRNNISYNIPVTEWRAGEDAFYGSGFNLAISSPLFFVFFPSDSEARETCERARKNKGNFRARSGILLVLKIRDFSLPRFHPPSRKRRLLSKARE